MTYTLPYPPTHTHNTPSLQVAERSFAKLLGEMITRDLKYLAPPSAGLPWHPAFHIDFTAISGKRGFTHAGITLGAMYAQQQHVQSELKLMTLAVGEVHDDLSGCRAMLGEGTEGIAFEIAEMVDRKTVEYTDADGELQCAPCEPVGCLDYAALRHILAKRGKCSAVCSHRGLAQLQSYPGDGKTDPIPDGDSLEVWHAAEAILSKECDYGSEMQSAEMIEAAGHNLPRGWSFDRDGSWKCPHCEEVVWRADGEYEEACAKLAKMRSDADDDPVIRKELNALLKSHADGHADSLLLERPGLRVASSFFVIDPMHALELNAGKVVFKYTTGDRMEEEHREDVAEYLDEIGCPLDVRAKGTRNPEQKWFSASTFDEFVLGKAAYPNSKSKGLAANMFEIMKIIYTPTLPTHSRYDDKPAEAPAPAPKAPKAKARSKSNKRMAPSGGFGAPKTPDELSQTPADAAAADAYIDLADLGEVDVTASNDTLREFLRARFGNHSREVCDNMRLWEAYGEVHSAWRDEWDSDDIEYRAKRALRFLRAGYPVTYNPVTYTPRELPPPPTRRHPLTAVCVTCAGQ